MPSATAGRPGPWLRSTCGTRPRLTRWNAGEACRLRLASVRRGCGGHGRQMSERWYKQAVIYCVDVETFQDSDGDGWGDLRGLTSRLDYLARLGVTCLWLNPIHPTPNRDNGYDVSDFYGVD